MSFCDLIGGDYGLLNRVKLLEAKLPAHENKTFLYSIVRTLAKRLPNGNSNEIDNRMLGGAAALIAALIHGVSSSQDSLVGWLVGINAGAVGQTHCAHRAVIAALCSDTSEYLQSIIPDRAVDVVSAQATRAMQKSLDLFGDKLYIKHTPILHQEGQKPTSFVPR